MIATLVAIPAAWPRFSITAADIQEIDQPFSQAFEIKNESLYPLYAVKITALVDRVTAESGQSEINIGMMSLQRPEISRMDPGDTATEALVMLHFPELPTKAEAGIEVEYRPLNLFTKVKLFRFLMSRNVDGTSFSWRKQPITSEFEARWKEHKAVGEKRRKAFRDRKGD